MQKNLSILSEAITIIESTNPQKSVLAKEIIEILSEHKSPKSIRIGITGPPGVGKSTWIDRFLLHLHQNQTAAVLTIDPSSKSSKGSILGDKTRMETLGKNQNVFIRPSPSGNVLGGISRKTKETMMLCEFAGFDYVCIETVGVGQSETEVSDVVDINILVLQPGTGDEIQGIKRGIMETADIIVINKFDGELKFIAEQTKRQLHSAISVFSHSLQHWQIPILLTSGYQNFGFLEVWNSVESFLSTSEKSNYFNNKRKQQNVKWFEVQISSAIQNLFFQDTDNASTFKKIKLEIQSKDLNPIIAQDRFLDIVKSNFNKKN